MNVMLDAPVNIQLLYLLCVISVTLIWTSHVVVIRRINIPSGAISYLVMLCMAYAYNYIQLNGLFWILVMLVAGVMYQRQCYRNIMMSILLVMGFLLASHTLPGFDNPVLLDNVRLSELSTPYSMYLSFDKISAGIIVFWSVFSVQERSRFNGAAFISAMPIAVITVMSSLLIASIGMIVFDFTLSPYVFLFAINNLFFTCMAEEAYFRGLIQKQLATRMHYVYAIVLSAVLFGVAHMGVGRVDYVIAAIVAGIGYGYVYHRTKSIGASIMTHWVLNLVHFVFFTYPFVSN